MFWFWDPVAKPLLDAVQPSAIVQIGAGDPESTSSLLAWALEHDCVVHVIEPSPGFDVPELQRRHGGALIIHREKSLEALPQIERIDAVLIDGDHNWYTVISELRLLAKQASSARRSFPLTLLHHVDWPYGRRDLYRDPSEIPDAHRHTFRRGGLVPGVAEPVGGQGLDRQHYISVREGEAETGVRTAVEDFLSESRFKLSFDSVPGGHGLGIVAPSSKSAAAKRVSRVLGHLRSPRFLAEHSARLELWRVSATIEGIDLQVALDEAQRELETLRKDTELQDRLRYQLAGLEANLVSDAARKAELEKEVEKLRAKLESRQGLEYKVVALEAKLGSEAARKAELEKEREKLTAKLESRQGLEYKVDALEKQRVKLSAKLESRQGLEDDVAALEANLVSAREQMAELMKERAKLVTGRAELEAQLGSRERLETEVEALKPVLESATDKASALKGKQGELEDLRTGLDTGLQAARADVARLEQLAGDRELTIGEYRSELRGLRRDVEQVAESRSWRLGHRAMRGLKRLTGRPEYGSDALQRIAERLHALELYEPEERPVGNAPGDEVGGALARLEDEGEAGDGAAGQDDGRRMINLSEVGIGPSGNLKELAAAREIADRRTAASLEANLAGSDAVLGTFREGLAPGWLDGEQEHLTQPSSGGSRDGRPALMVGTLSSGENELAECQRSVGRQTYKPLDHVVIGALPKKEAVATLMERFLDSDFDYMIKVDGDMVLLDRGFIERAVTILEANEQIDLLQMAILDYFSGAPMQGVNAYRRSVEWRADRQNPLFSDRSFVAKSKRLVTWAPFARAAIHSPNPSSLQAFHFGVHRGLKVLQPDQATLDLPQAVEQTTYLERTWDHFLSRRDPRLAMACLGFERALAGEFKLEHLDYGDSTLRTALGEFEGLGAAELERLVRKRREDRVKAAPVQQLRRDRRRILWRSAATIRSVVALLPHFGMYGGVNRFFELAQALGDRGIECVLAKPDPNSLGIRKQFPDSRQDYPTVETRSYRDALARSWDVVLCGDCTSGVMLTMPMFDARISAVYLLNGWMRREANVQQTRLVDPDVVIANSSYAARFYQDLAPVVVPGGVDLATFRPDPPGRPLSANGSGAENGRLRVIAYAGRRKPIKGFEDVVAACTLLHEGGVPVELNIYDTTPFELEAPFPWRHHGALPPEGLSDLLGQMDVMISAERDAGWSNPTAEAMACGVPVVCTEAGTSDFAIDGETALVVPVHDPDAIAAAARRLWEEPGLAASLRAEGLERIAGFGWPSVAAGLIEALDFARGDGARRRVLNEGAKAKLAALAGQFGETPDPGVPGQPA